MLTDDEKKEILELYGRGYSHRKISDRTGHSETTIRNVIDKARREVAKLKDNGLQVEQIASQLDYPLAFVSRILRKHEEKQGEESKAEVEAEVEPAVEVEVNEAPKISAIKTGWSDFQRNRDIEQRKEKIRREAIESIDNLKFWKEHLREEQVLDIDYDRRQRGIRKELEDFVLIKVNEIDSTEALYDFERVIEEINGKIVALFEEYEKKVAEATKTRKAKEIARSDELLNSRIDIPMFPEFVKEKIKDSFLVRNLEEASIVFDALSQVALVIMKTSDFKLEQNDKMWQGFMSIIRDGGWDYLKKMAFTYRKDLEGALVSINYCPACNSRLTRKHVEGKTIASCPSCNKAWRF